MREKEGDKDMKIWRKKEEKRENETERKEGIKNTKQNIAWKKERKKESKAKRERENKKEKKES